MRGNPYQIPAAGMGFRSIPAYAGEPWPGAAIPARGWVYPRVCGGTARTAYWPTSAYGLSPRMRGNRDMNPRPAADLRSIPAYAGEPFAYAGGARNGGVYPRVCGGT